MIMLIQTIIIRLIITKIILKKTCKMIKIINKNKNQNNNNKIILMKRKLTVIKKLKLNNLIYKT